MCGGNNFCLCWWTGPTTLSLLETSSAYNRVSEQPDMTHNLACSSWVHWLSFQHNFQPFLPGLFRYLLSIVHAFLLPLSTSTTPNCFDNCMRQIYGVSMTTRSECLTAVVHVPDLRCGTAGHRQFYNQCGQWGPVHWEWSVRHKYNGSCASWLVKLKHRTSIKYFVLEEVCKLRRGNSDHSRWI